MSSTKQTSHSHHVEPHDPNFGYEIRDARARPLIWGGVATFVLLIASFLIIAGLLFLFGSNPRQTGNTLPENFQPRLPTSGPILQQDGDLEGDVYIAQETEKLETYGWINRRAGTVHIPIERAMELTVERGVTGGSE
jgi:hypothetical protein